MLDCFYTNFHLPLFWWPFSWLQLQYKVCLLWLWFGFLCGCIWEHCDLNRINIIGALLMWIIRALLMWIVGALSVNRITPNTLHGYQTPRTAHTDMSRWTAAATGTTWQGKHVDQSTSLTRRHRTYRRHVGT